MKIQRPIIGIDLGTTNSIACVWQNGESQFIPNALGEILTPSVVGIDDEGSVICGQPARERLYTHPELTAAVFKRYMGSSKVMQLGNQSFKPEELSAMVLKSIKADAEAFLGHEVFEAIITVPAYFNDTQRKTTCVAGELAGLTVDRLLNEPTAAALAYGLHEKNEAQFLIFDLGGGTFDVSVLELFDGVMEVRASAGNNQLGGEDFTGILVDDFVASLREANIENELLAKQFNHRIVAEAERAKCALSTTKEYEMSVNLDELTHTHTITRSHFEQLAASLLKKIHLPVKQALHDSSIRPSELDAIVLVGGATRMSMIPKLVTSMFGRFPERDLDPDTVVGVGASVQAALKQRDKAVKDVVLTDICPYTLGIEVATELPGGKSRAGVFSPIIERNTVVPVSREERYITAEDDQSFINAKVYQGESRYTRDNIFLGNLEVPIDEAPAGEQAVDIRFSYDVNGLLEVDATVVGSGQTASTVITNKDGQLSDEEISKSLEKLKALKMHPRENTHNIAAIYKGNRLYEQNLGERREQIGYLLDQFISVLDSQDENEIEKAREHFSDMLVAFEQ